MEQDTSGGGETRSGAPLRAVVCDDDDVICRVVARLAEQAGYDVAATLDNTYDLLQVVRLVQPTVVVLDIVLEGISGAEAIGEIREVSPGTVIVAFSAFEPLQHALDRGAHRAVAKTDMPELERLLGVIARAGA